MTVRTRIIRLLFTLFFCLYAVSPTFTRIALDNVLDAADDPLTATSVSRSVGLFFWEFACSQLVLTEDDAGADGSTVNVLIKKKRAIVPKNDAAKAKALEDASIPEPQFLFAPPAIFQPLLSAEPLVATNNFFHLYSGLSPPSA